MVNKLLIEMSYDQITEKIDLKNLFSLYKHNQCLDSINEKTT